MDCSWVEYMFNCIGYKDVTVTYNNIYGYYNVVINISINELTKLYENENKWKITTNYLAMCMNRSELPVKLWLNTPLVYDSFE